MGGKEVRVHLFLWAGTVLFQAELIDFAAATSHIRWRPRKDFYLYRQQSRTYSTAKHRRGIKTHHGIPKNAKESY